MKLIDWFRKKIYKNYVPLEKYNSVIAGKDNIIALEELTNKVHRGEIQELKHKISILESEKFFKPVVTEPIRFRELMSQTTLSALEVKTLPQDVFNSRIVDTLTLSLTDELKDHIIITEYYDGLRDVYKYKAKIYIGTKGDI